MRIFGVFIYKAAETVQLRFNKCLLLLMFTANFSEYFTLTDSFVLVMTLHAQAVLADLILCLFLSVPIVVEIAVDKYRAFRYQFLLEIGLVAEGIRWNPRSRLVVIS